MRSVLGSATEDTGQRATSLRKSKRVTAAIDGGTRPLAAIVADRTTGTIRAIEGVGEGGDDGAVDQ
jgi:hypothetical protein